MVDADGHYHARYWTVCDRIAFQFEDGEIEVTGCDTNAEKFKQQRQASHTGTLVLDDDEAYVGDTVTLNGRNLPENAHLDIIWQTAQGHWGILQGNEEWPSRRSTPGQY